MSELKTLAVPSSRERVDEESNQDPDYKKLRTQAAQKLSELLRVWVKVNASQFDSNAPIIPQVARFLDLNVSTLRHYFEGESFPWAKKALAVEERTGLPVVELLNSCSNQQFNLTDRPRLKDFDPQRPESFKLEKSTDTEERRPVQDQQQEPTASQEISKSVAPETEPRTVFEIERFHVQRVYELLFQAAPHITYLVENQCDEAIDQLIALFGSNERGRGKLDNLLSYVRALQSPDLRKAFLEDHDYLTFKA